MQLATRSCFLSSELLTSNALTIYHFSYGNPTRSLSVIILFHLYDQMSPPFLEDVFDTQER